MEVVLSLWSDAAALCLFDPAACAAVDPAALRFPFHLNPAVRDGQAVMLALPGDGCFTVRLADRAPTVEEARAIHHSVSRLGLEVKSGSV
ncbi:MAG: hypothetical protein HY825_01510 [Acidobacteria bacterium]|nr:hypothetical protein [Acidobacteriota bacterium]